MVADRGRSDSENDPVADPLNRIGIMDWGIGGLSVYRALRDSGSALDAVYLSDSGNAPYGKQDRRRLRARFGEIAEFFRNQGVYRVLVACNSASSALDREPEEIAGVRFESIIPAGVRAAGASPKNRIGVIGSDLTIGSKIYETRLRAPGKAFAFTSAQPLSALVERGELSGETVRREVRAVLDRLGPIDSLLLACTHYPALGPVFREFSPGLELLDPGEAMVEGLPRDGDGSLRFFTTGSGNLSRRAARAAFGVELAAVQELGLGLQAK